jgi:hypothetical protein
MLPLFLYLLFFLISEAVFFALVSQGGGDLGAFGVVHGNLWREIRIVGDAVYQMVNGAITIVPEGIRKTWKDIGVMFGQDSEVQAMEGEHDHVPTDLVHEPVSSPPPLYQVSSQSLNIVLLLTCATDTVSW